ncbi:MAG: sialidase family protein [candidate division WOR-3 bacterium]
MTQRVFFLTMAVTSLLMAQWGPDVRLTNDPAWSGTAYSNACCVAATGDTVHVVWSDYRGGTAGIYYKRSLDRGTTWSADTRLDSSTANAVFPCLVAAGSTLHLAWTDYRNGNSETYYKRSTNAGASWSLDVRLTNDTFPTYTASVAVAGAYVHVVFGDWRSGNEEVYYKRSTDAGATWGPDTRLTNATGYSSYPAVAAGGNTVHVAWQDTRDGNYEIYYKRSITGGASWFTDVRLTANPTNSASAAIAAADSTVHVVWYDDLSGDYELYHKYSTDGGATWGPDLRLTTSPGRSIFHSLAAVGNEVHLVWEDERDGNQEVYYKRSTDRGLSWSADLRLTTSPDSSALPSIAFSGGTSHVVWSDRRNGNMEAYYKRGFVSDVGCTRIIAPLGNVDSGQVVTPRAWVRNFGTVTVSFGVRLSIGSSYTDSVTVSNLAGGDSMLLNFPAWTATQTGIHIVRCSTRLNGDVNPANDRRVDSVRVVTAPRPFDVGVTRIVAPFGDAEPGSTVSPTAAWRNFGDTVASFLA